MEFGYSQLDPETAKKLKEHAEVIKKQLSILGNACWSAGRKMIGEKATKEQIANLLSNIWNHDKATLLHAMEWVDKNE